MSSSARMVSYLFVPASRPDRIEKARTSRAHVVIVDLEDAVAEPDKAAAREGLATMPPGRQVHVRVNQVGSPHHGADVEVARALALVGAVVVPKAETVDAVAAVISALGTKPVLALIETARGIVAADGIAGAGVDRLLFGSVDYLTDISAARGREVLAYPRSRLVVASRAAGLPPPVDGPFLATEDDEELRCDAEDAKALGMGAKMCIHPGQLETVEAVFRASAEERRWAGAVLAAADRNGGGAFAFEGAMVDEPVLARARRLVEGP